MKKHLVIVCGILYPNPSPTGLCAARYASLLAEDYDIDYISLSADGREEEGLYEGHVVYTISSKRMKWEYCSRGVIKKLIHLVGTSQLKLSLMGNMGWFVNAANKKLEEINTIKKIDVILTVCSPFQAHMAGAKFKANHPEVRFCSYTVDPYASKTRVVPFFRSYQDFVSLEREVSSKPDCLFLSEEAINMRRDIYGGLDNTVALPYLLPESKEVLGRVFDSDHIHCVYAGSFYKDIRNPEYMLKVFSSLKENRVMLHLYSSGCEDIVLRYSENSSRIITHGYVSHDELQRVYASCDFLIGVGNAMNDFLPSKTYEYLSLCRPIVFFNSAGYDNKVLERYPHSLQLSDDMSIEASSELFEAFVKRERGKVISEDELKKIYSDNTDVNIRRILLNGLNENWYG